MEFLFPHGFHYPPEFHIPPLTGTELFHIGPLSYTNSHFTMLLVGTLLVRLPVAYVCGIVLEGGLYGAWLGMCGDVTIRAVRVPTPLQVDGRLEEPFYTATEAITGFMQTLPTERGEPSERTEAWVGSTKGA